jgi:hypothetical protein
MSLKSTRCLGALVLALTALGCTQSAPVAENPPSDAVDQPVTPEGERELPTTLPAGPAELPEQSGSRLAPTLDSASPTRPVPDSPPKPAQSAAPITDSKPPVELPDDSGEKSAARAFGNAVYKALSSMAPGAGMRTLGGPAEVRGEPVGRPDPQN